MTQVWLVWCGFGPEEPTIVAAFFTEDNAKQGIETDLTTVFGSQNEATLHRLRTGGYYWIEPVELRC